MGVSFVILDILYAQLFFTQEAIVHEEAVLLIPEVEDVVVLVEEDVAVEDPTWE